MMVDKSVSYFLGLDANLNVPVTARQFDAMVSLAFNYGARSAQVVTVTGFFNRGDPAGAAAYVSGLSQNVAR
jgi:GH24 family phage-related lysozyme (muramidase)